ncbi:thioredoxin family protein [Proteiniclasticum sp. QWL-01]|uniref:thioredoxin family protein n=1 Tax=Proteiniclasticum sp. QWL-01 TaxID=3036945 RepID=UPI00220B6E00|nr:thioredoxin family protein [Proteiniclasticum sp. QWL-01]UUM12284.1 thioredoxin family protein [Clostridiaceae bacterium HFYG-1003]WFF73816.1 thioredoxin family protein [Proteiniclasticum sp. QWL-01]
MKIKILGSGCANCKKLEANAKEALKELGLQGEVEKVEDLREIVAYGVMRTPALVVDDTVRVMGKVATVEEIRQLLDPTS